MKRKEHLEKVTRAESKTEFKTKLESTSRIVDDSSIKSNPWDTVEGYLKDRFTIIDSPYLKKIKPTVKKSSNPNKNFYYPIKIYLESGDIKDLYKFLFKNQILHTGFEFIKYCIPPNVTREEIISSLQSDIESFKDNLLYDIAEYLSNDYTTNESNKILDFINSDLLTIVTDLLIVYPENIISFHFNTKDIYLDLIKEFTIRNIEIDKDLLDLKNTDFKDLRVRNTNIKVFYAECVDCLLFITDSYIDHDATSLDVKFYSRLKDIDIQETSNNNNSEKIIINNQEYSKTAFENMIETNVDNFLYNLELESYINERENIEGNLGDGNNSSSKKLELL